MRIFQIVFSPTGGTKKVADCLTAPFETVEPVDLSSPDITYNGLQLTSDDFAVIAMPSFGGLAPQAAIQRLEQIQGNGCRCVISAVFGNRAYDNTLVQMEDSAEKNEFQVIGAVAAVAQHSMAPHVANNRPDRLDQEELEKFANQIKEKVEHGETSKPSVPGTRPYKTGGSFPVRPKAHKGCTSCGTCAKLCPVKAIDPQDPKKVDKKKCISCMRCVAVCPEKCRKINGLISSASGMMLRKICSDRKNNELYL